MGSNPGVIGKKKNDHIDSVVRRGEYLQVSLENGGLIKKALVVYSEKKETVGSAEKNTTVTEQPQSHCCDFVVY